MTESDPIAILTVEEISDYLKIPKSTIYKLVREGKIPAKKIGRHWRFRKEVIDHWLSGMRPSKVASQTQQ